MIITAAPKNQMIADELRDQIISGHYSGKLPTDRKFATTYNVNVKTVQKALNLLAREGKVYRIQGSGTYVGQEPKNQRSSRIVGMCISTDGDIYEGLSTALIKNLQQLGYLPTVANITGSPFITDPVSFIDDLLNVQPAGLLVWGIESFPFDHLEKRRSQIPKLVFVLSMEVEPKIRADYVLSDFWHGGYTGTIHLIGLGHKKIALITHKSTHKPRHYQFTIQNDFIQGYRSALEEAGLLDNENCFFEGPDNSENIRNLNDLLSRQDRPTAIVVTDDFRAVRAYEAACSVGIQVPQDLALVGYYNTPFGEKLAVPLTSFNIKVEELASIAAERIKSEQTGERIIIKPELIVRKSCGGKK